MWNAKNYNIITNIFRLFSMPKLSNSADNLTIFGSDAKLFSILVKLDW